MYQVDVEQGQIHVEYVDVVFRRISCWILEIGTRQKYPEIGAYSRESVHLFASERTPARSYDPDAAGTTVRFPAHVRGWEVLPEAWGRYSLRVMLWHPRPDETRVQLWSSTGILRDYDREKA